MAIKINDSSMNLIQNLYQRIESENLWEKELNLKRKEYLKVGGTIDLNLYYIISGSLRVFIINDENEENEIRFGYRHNFIVSLDSFFTEKPSEFYIQALKNTKLKVISKQAYLEFINNSKENKMLWDRLLEQLILQQMEREKDILTSSPKIRFQRVLKRSPQLFQEIPNKYIASYLRMTPETLSRLKNLDPDQD